MITVYAQYSFGGYKIFRLAENSVEEVTRENMMGLPQSALQLFSHYGIKLLCAADINQNYILFVNDMPCKEKDDMGRSKTCSVLISSRDRADIPAIRRIAFKIASDLDSFETFFSSLFSIKDTLNFDFTGLKAFIETDYAAPLTHNNKMHKVLVSKNDSIIVYTTTNFKTAIAPLYPRFGKENIRHGLLMKWNENERSICGHSIERIGFIHHIQQIINKFTTIWKN